jgi:hypothetical protein
LNSSLVYFLFFPFEFKQGTMTLLPIFLAILCLAAYSTVLSQPRSPNSSRIIHISIVPTFGSNNIRLADSSFHAPDAHDSTSVQIDVLKFYVSRIQFLSNGVVVVEEPQSVHLIDAAVKASFHCAIPNMHKTPFDAVRFNLGIDSVANVSGALGGDLDPTKGMYWTWQNGYINLKFEGKSNRSTARNNEFQFHLGGYREPLNCLQVVTLPVRNAEAITIQFNAETLLSHIEMATHHHIMSPSVEAVRLSAIAARSFRIVHSVPTK